MNMNVIKGGTMFRSIQGTIYMENYRKEKEEAMEITDEQYEVLNRLIDKLTDAVVHVNTGLTIVTEQCNDLSERVTKLEVSHFGQGYGR